MADNVPLDPTSIDHTPSERAAEVGRNSVRQDSSGYGYGCSLLGEPETHLLDYVRVLYKRRWTAVTAFLTVFVAVTIYVFTATPRYTSRAQILIEKENANVVSFKEAFEQNQITDDYYQTQYRLLQSRALARRTLDSLQLWNHPQFSPPRTNTISVGALVRASAAKVDSWFTTAPPVEEPAADETKGQSAAIDRFLDALTVSPIRN